MKEKLKPFSRREYERIKRNAEQLGYTVLTKYRKGIKGIKLNPVVLSYGSPN